MKKTFIAKVLSNKMTKTVVVSVERKYSHPKYRKIIIRHKKFKAHNEKLELNIGDMVKIIECNPISKDKHFSVVEKVDSKINK